MMTKEKQALRKLKNLLDTNDSVIANLVRAGYTINYKMLEKLAK